MSAVEAAASLFGPDDPSADPFSSLGQDTSGAASNSGPTVNDELFSHADPDASALFAADQTPDPFLESNGEVTHSVPQQDAYPAYGYGQLEEHGSYTGEESGGYYYQAGYGQTYEGYEAQSVSAEPNHEAHSYSVSDSTHGAYVPPALSVRSVSSSAMGSGLYPAYPQSTHNSYERPITPSASTVSSASSALTPSTPYDPYNPVPSPSRPNVPASTSSYLQIQQPSYGSAEFSLPAPPSPSKPPASPFRPKFLNAYDPPLLPSRSSKLSYARPPRSVSPMAPQQTLATQPLPPPPPRSASASSPPVTANRSSFQANAGSVGHQSRTPASYGHGNGIHGHMNGSTYHNAGNYGLGRRDLSRSPPYKPASVVHSPPAGEYGPVGGNGLYPPTEVPSSGSSGNFDYGRETHHPLNGIPNNASTIHSGPPVHSRPQIGPGATFFDGVSSNSENLNVSPPPAPQRLGLVHEGQITALSQLSPHTVPSAPSYDTDLEGAEAGPTLKSPQVSYSPYEPPVNRSLSPNSYSISPPNNNARAQSPPQYAPPIQPGLASANSRTSSPESIRSHPPNRPSSVTSAGPAYHPDVVNSRARASHNAHRTASPSSHSVHSLDSASQALYDSSLGKAGPGQNLEHMVGSAVPENSSQSGTSRSRGGSQSSWSAYAPPVPNHVSETHARSMSNGSALSTSSGSYTHPYAPANFNSVPKRHVIDPAHAAFTPNHFSQEFGGPEGAHVHSPPLVSQEVTYLAPARPAYAPSPSLIGSNDPLGRTAVRVPVVTFGFGGRLVTCFHGSSGLNSGFDVALSSRYSTDIKIRVLRQIVPESALNTSATSFPGPLFGDPGTPTTSLVRTGTSQTKAKKAKVTNYLDGRIEELSLAIGYLHAGSMDRSQAEDKLVLVKLLKLMVENDGRLTGSVDIDSSVRAALIPRIKDSIPSTSDPTAISTFIPVPDKHSSVDGTDHLYHGLNSSSGRDGTKPVSVSTVYPSTLDRIQEFLLRGDRRHAYHYALDEKLWSHALIIASSIDKEAWQEVVNEFLRSELGVKDQRARVNGRESLRVAYSLFSGQGPAAVQQLIPPSFLSAVGMGNNLSVPTPAVSQLTPVSPNFPPPSMTANVPPESLSSWTETAAMIMSNPLSPEASGALTCLGDFLITNQRIEAAHACYLLGPPAALFGGIGTPSARISLLGSRSPYGWSGFQKDPDCIILTEIAEFALSLSPVPKGQEAFIGLSYFQAFKFLRALNLAELGHVQLANRYCDAISSSLGRPSPYFTHPFSQQLNELTKRLNGAPEMEKSGSWIGGKMTKPSLDSFGKWVEGRFTKFIAGEGDPSPSPSDEPPKVEHSAYAGPFAHYSAISSEAPSTSSSPQPSISNLNLMASSAPVHSGSAMAHHMDSMSHHPIDRASSATDYSRPPQRNMSPVPRVASANAATTSFSQSHPYGQMFRTSGFDDNTVVETAEPVQDSEVANGQADAENGAQTGAWWGSSHGEESSATPTAVSFMRVKEAVAAPASDGFISLMDDVPVTAATSSFYSRSPKPAFPADDDEDDLGLGNSTKTEKKDISGEASPSSDVPTKAQGAPAQVSAERPELKQASSGSWLSRFWKKSEITPGPVKANLGEETTFYYDKELKRWVNKKVGDKAEKPAIPPPPPSRAQTVSPGGGRAKPPIGSGPPPSGPPLARPASAMDVGNSQRLPPSRLRSNLTPSDMRSAPNTPAAASMHQPQDLPPPPSRPRSQAASKKTVRSRYVDVFQQQESMPQ